MKTLRLTFAMGGGVSLGSFSGAALTEILKALVLHGQDRDGNPYDKIVLDSMSGASAGAIALAILLRSLMDYTVIAARISEHYILTENKTGADDFYKLEDRTARHTQNKDDFLKIIGKKIDALLDENGILDPKKREEIKEPLVAIEVAQLLQEILWVREVNLRSLLKSTSQDGQTENFSLLPRDTIIKQTRKYLLPKDGERTKPGNMNILGSRVLFACSLTNLVPNRIVENVEGIKLDEFPQIRERKRALNSKSHKELRVFDFKLQPSILKAEGLDTSESNWLELSPEIVDNEDCPLRSDINKPDAWARIAASVIACGAFPIAFSPVILKRWKAEFPQYSKELPLDNTHQYNSVWEVPKVVDHKLPYVDGGTFNNEPIREAFRLANYIDTNLRNNKDFKTERDAFDRLVVFVDPIVDSGDLSYHMSSYSQLAASFRKRSLYKITKQKALPKITSLSGRLIGMLRNQGSVKEEHKISNYLDQVQLKAKLSAHLNLLKIPIDDSEEELELFKEITHHVDKALMRGMIPLGTRDIGKYFFWKAQEELKQDMERSHKEKISLKTTDLQNAFFKKIGKTNINKLAELFGIDQEASGRIIEKKTHQTLNYQPFGDLIEKLREPDLKETKFSEVFDQFFKEKTGVYLSLREFIKRVFFNMAIDAALDIDGKDPRAVQLAITPVSYKEKKQDDPYDRDDAKTISLPGAEIQAFGGFMSRSSREYAFKYGQYCALQTLQRNEFRAYYSKLGLDVLSDPDVPPAPFVPERTFDQAVERFKKQLDQSKEANLNGQLKEDLELLKKSKIIWPLLGRVLGIFPNIKRQLIRWSLWLPLAWLLIAAGIFYAQEYEISFWTVLVSLSVSLTILLVGGLVYIAWKLWNRKRTSGGSLFEEMESFPNYELMAVWKVKDGERVKAVRLNKRRRYIRTFSLWYKDKEYMGIKLFLRQTEQNGYERRYDLFSYRRSARNWSYSPFSSYMHSLNWGGNDQEKINFIHYSRQNRWRRSLPFFQKKEHSLKIDPDFFEPNGIERLKFFIDPAIVMDEKGEEEDYEKYICLTRELEEIIKEVG